MRSRGLTGTTFSPQGPSLRYSDSRLRFSQTSAASKAPSTASSSSNNDKNDALGAASCANAGMHSKRARATIAPRITVLSQLDGLDMPRLSLLRTRIIGAAEYSPRSAPGGRCRVMTTLSDSLQRPDNTADLPSDHGRY